MAVVAWLQLHLLLCGSRAAAQLQRARPPWLTLSCCCPQPALQQCPQSSHLQSEGVPWGLRGPTELFYVQLRHSARLRTASHASAGRRLLTHVLGLYQAR